MEGHSGKPLYLSIAPRFITNRGVFCFVRMFFVHESLTLLIQCGMVEFFCKAHPEPGEDYPDDVPGGDGFCRFEKRMK